MPQGHYSVGEVLWLLGLSHRDAVLEDASPPSALGHLSDVLGEGGSGSSAEPDLPVIARWQDVHVARARVHARKGDAAVAALELRAQGLTEGEVAAATELERSAVRRRVTAGVREILDELGGESAGEEMALSRVSTCLRCHRHPRARWAAVRRRVRGGWRTIRPERQASLCAACLPEEVHHLLLRPDAP